MSPLNIHPEDAVNAPKKKKNKSLKVMLGIAALVAVPVVGTTLAASIGINVNNNSNTPIQFGQGVVQATACDDEVTVTANAAFTNATGAGSFKLTTISVSGIASTCNNEVFTIKVYDDANQAALTVAAPSASPNGASATAVGVTFLTAGSTIVGNTNATVSASDSTSFTVTLATTLSSLSVYKITIESS